MEPASLGAFRQYQIAKQVMGPVSGQAPAAVETSKAGASPVAEGVKQFSEVFEKVEVATEAMATGQGNAHAVVEALATAEVALETAVTIRNRVVEAYQELLRMPV
ncbi:MAG: flagellar hook-basal body complex protein FliE [Alphaproteobacteria bacterium]